MTTKTLKIKAADLRLGDHIINLGKITTVGSATTHGLRVWYETGVSYYWRLDEDITIERHEPEVTEGWINLYANPEQRGTRWPSRWEAANRANVGKPVAVELVDL